MGNMNEKKPLMTVGKFAAGTLELLKEKGLLPDILDYASPVKESERDGRFPLRSSDFVIWGYPNLGASEGIYLDLFIRVWDETDNPDESRINFITFKTLDDSDDALRTMCSLLGECMICAKEYEKAHHVDFQRSGYKLIRCDDVEDKSVCYIFYSEEAAVEKALPGKFKILSRYTLEEREYEKDISGSIKYIVN